jgi:hypothetical protein
MCGGRRSIIHQLRSKTASEIFSHPSIYYTVDYKRADIAEFQARLKFPGTIGYSKYAPVLFPDGKRDMKNIFRSVELTKVKSRHQKIHRSVNNFN